MREKSMPSGEKGRKQYKPNRSSDALRLEERELTFITGTGNRKEFVCKFCQWVRIHFIFSFETDSFSSALHR